MIHGTAPIAAFSLGHLTLGRVLIAAFMVALFIGPRRWMMWASARRRRPAPPLPPETGESPDPSAAPDAAATKAGPDDVEEAGPPD